ncbi:DNA methyltransferase, partial [Paucilactobacillus nenjiangensis]|uniref:DNA methyltransferase n=1 Tax=Paucilactobacillus nenjiangensis TaxID=1296540 RepID=UPI003BB1C0BC
MTRKEYELTYYGKESRQSIISKTFAAPIQIDREFGTDQTSGSWLNKIIFGDNLQVLKTLTEWKKNGDLKNADGTDGARVVYIDPPFASKQDFSNKDERAYADKLKGANFLEWLRKRLILLREVLADDGTILVHLDWHKSHYVKVLLDEIFGETNFRNEIIWHYQTYQGHVFKYFPRKHD